MSSSKVKLPAYADNPIYKMIDDAVTSVIVIIFDAINPRGIVLTEEEIKKIMAKQQEGGAYKGFVQDFLDYFNQLIFKDCPIIGYSLLAAAAYVSYLIIINYTKKV
jgi:hypothetical protein